MGTRHIEAIRILYGVHDVVGLGIPSRGHSQSALTMDLAFHTSYRGYMDNIGGQYRGI